MQALLPLEDDHDEAEGEDRKDKAALERLMARLEEEGCKIEDGNSRRAVEFGGGGDGSGGGGGGSGGGDYERWDSNHGSGSMDEYYQSMIEANPGNSMILGNYAKFLKEVFI